MTVRLTVPLRLTLQNHPAELTRLSQWARQLTDDLAASDRDRLRVDLVLTEVVTNAITHGLPAGQPADIVVEAQWNEPVLSVVVTDGAPPFDPLSTEVRELPRRLADAEPGGLGLVLIRSYVDDAHYVRTENQNRLTVIFRWPRP